ncbi:MAG: TetR/AcrR family transcriptional regulator [Actinomycetota bacterium]|nr:TetR/AcrR family transcriptional regulator [Actinomycetota bacterium]
MSNPGDRRAAQKARRRERIRCTAQALFAEHGFEAVTIVQVASEARVSVRRRL